MFMSSPLPIDRFITTPQGRLFTRCWRSDLLAQRAPIILFHDSLGSVQQWRDFPTLLSQASQRSVIAYDRLGFGQSDHNSTQLQSYFVQAEAEHGLAPLRHAFHIDHMILLGHSVGGGMALAAAAAFPDVTDGVISIAARAFTEDQTLDGIRQAKNAFQDAGQMERLAKYHGDKSRWVLDAWIETWLGPAFAHWSLDAELGRITCPILALHGDQDEYGSNAHPQRIAAQAKTPVQAVILPDCHHMPHREMPDMVLKLISKFLAQLPAWQTFASASS